MKRAVVLKMTVLVGSAATLVTGLCAGEVQFAPPERLQVPGLEKLEGPEVVDYDGDGVRDLLSGNYGGNLIFRKNIGSNEKPAYAEPVKLRRGGEDIKLKHW